jgi:hypothetical protein
VYSCSGHRPTAALIPHTPIIHQVYIAAVAVQAEQAFEQTLLQKALGAAQTPFLDYLPALWNETRALGRDDFDAQQMRNATCMCGPGAASALAGTAGFADEAAWQSSVNCSGEREWVWVASSRLDRYHHPCILTNQNHPTPGITELNQRTWGANSSSITVISGADPAVCSEALANITAHRATLNATMLGWVGGCVGGG